MDGVLSAHRERGCTENRHCSAHCGLLVNFVREWLVSRTVGKREDRRKGWDGGARGGGAIQELFLSHQSWYLRARARPGTIPKARRKESLGFTQGTEPSSTTYLPPSRPPAYSPHDPDHSSDNNIRTDDVETER